MALILHIETATPVCSTAISRNGELLDIRETNDPRSHASRLTPFIEDLMTSNNISYTSLDAVSISMGPGSYTGLRIGVSTAKGIAFGVEIPVIGVSTLQALANKFVKENQNLLSKISNPVFCPMLDARRMEVYSAFYSLKLELKREVMADIIDTNSYLEYLDAGPVFFFGDGSQKCKEIIKHPNARFIPDIEPSSKHMISLAETAWAEKEFLDTAYFEPFYLKDFIATIPKNKIIPPQKTKA
jgi:tRNA threonylcarbamoyladenosine biosynthesis protein TsaB